MSEVPANIKKFLKLSTPVEWLDLAVSRLPILLLDHANCEKKAASSALSIIFRYPQHRQLVLQMSRIAREELRHFEQVQKLLLKNNIAQQSVPTSAYAATLREAVRSSEPDRLVDTLIVGALIEARSCERFALLAPLLPPAIADFYTGLLNSEKRHFENYLDLARRHGDAIEQRVDKLATLEGELVMRIDPVFAFHSGRPSASL